eukprot:scaffold73971_cov64-Phaeocystis_antarctica.AAC.2
MGCGALAALHVLPSRRSSGPPVQGRGRPVGGPRQCARARRPRPKPSSIAQRYQHDARAGHKNLGQNCLRGHTRAERRRPCPRSSGSR